MKKIIILICSLFLFCSCIDKNQFEMPDYVYVSMKKYQNDFFFSDSIFNNDTFVFDFLITAKCGAKAAIFKINGNNFNFVDTFYFTDTVSVKADCPINLNTTQDTVLQFDISAISLESRITYTNSLYLKVK